MSYARFDDVHEDGQLSQFRERLATEVRAQTGREFVIFQDRTDIAWGQNWAQRIEETLDVVTLLLVVITPGFFASGACRDEVIRFQQRERDLARADLILPVYYISSREMDDPATRESDDMASVLASRQFADWRELRFEPFTSPVVRKAVAQLASRMRDTFWLPSPVAVRPAGERRQQSVEAASPAAQADAGDQVTAKKEPPTHVVDAWQRGDFATLGEAVKAARPGDRILVRPGLYEESLVVDKPLEILGDGPVAEIEIRARGADTLLFQASIGRVANLTLRQADSEGTWCAVAIMQGRLDLEGCDISSQCHAGVAIRNGADPRLRRNQIHDGGESGLYVYDGGLGTLEDNDIFGNTLSGVTIDSGANPTLRRNQIHGSKQCGVYVSENGLGTLEENDITGNTMAAVEIRTGGNPTLRRNQIHDGKAGGVYIHDEGLGTLEDNHIAGHALSGVEIKSGANPTLNRNQIHDGVYVYDNGLGTLEDNDITGNTMAGVEIATRGNPTLSRNRIHDGVYVYDNGLGTLEDNDITGNTLSGVEIATNANPTLNRNQIHHSAQCGVYVYDNGLGTLEDNDITDNSLAGVEIAAGGNPTVRLNRVNRNGQEAVRIYPGGRGVIQDNDLTGNTLGPWNIPADSEAAVTRARNKV
jgi:F-box protein 11